MSDKEKELAELRNSQKDAMKERLALDSKDRLKDIASSKFRTCYIYALAEFENIFGCEIWGHGLSDSELTTDQKVNKIRWDRIRKNILDKGNTQSRALGMEIDLHTVNFSGYRITFGGRSNGTTNKDS